MYISPRTGTKKREKQMARKEVGSFPNMYQGLASFSNTSSIVTHKDVNIIKTHNKVRAFKSFNMYHDLFRITCEGPFQEF